MRSTSCPTVPQAYLCRDDRLFFAVTNAVKLVPYSMLGLLKASSIGTIVLLAPFCIIGVKLGVWLNRRVSEVWFMRLVYSILFLSGIQLIWTGIVGDSREPTTSAPGTSPCRDPAKNFGNNLLDRSIESSDNWSYG